VGIAMTNTVQIARQISVMWKKWGIKSVIQILWKCVMQNLVKLALLKERKIIKVENLNKFWN